MRRQHRSGAPPTRRGVGPRVDLTGIGLEVELQYPSQLRPPTDQDQGLGPLREIGRELNRVQGSGEKNEVITAVAASTITMSRYSAAADR